MDTIFKNFICQKGSPDSDLKKGYTLWFVDAFPETEFTGDDLLFWNYLKYSATLSVSVCKEYFDIWIANELRRVLLRTNAKVPGCETLNYSTPSAFETALSTTKFVMNDAFVALEAMSSVDDSDFIVDMHSFMQKRRSIRLDEVMRSTYDFKSRTDDSAEAINYAQQELQIISEIYSEEKLEDLTAISDSESDYYFVSDCGIPLIDNDSRGIWTKQVFDVEAQSGAGKTRFVLGTYIYRCAVVHKRNALFITMEQPVEEIKAMLVALHTFNMFNIQVDANLIVKNLVPDEVKSSVEAARIDLFETGKYGKICIEYKVLKRETFIGKLNALDKLKGPFDLIAIDYLGLFEQESKSKRTDDKYVIISDSLKFFKRWCVRKNKAGITISQFNRDGVAAGLADKTITTEHAEGGISVFRHCDYNIAISFTEDMRAKNIRRVQNPKIRSSAGFPRFLCDTRLAFCYWRQKQMMEV